jgi:ribose-phosphate pyrophosphokinase
MIVLTMPGSERLGRIAGDMHSATGGVEVHRFPDGEGRIRITGPVEGEDAVLVAGLERPDEKVLPLLFAAATARDLGAASVGLVAPYLPYLRQDRRFHAGEGVSARYSTRLLSRSVDWLVTVDPHLHRIPRLADLFSIPAEAVHAAPLLAGWIRRHVEAISSGSTMAAAVRALRAAGWPAPVCLAVHGLFAEGAHAVLRSAGAAVIVTCNTIPHPSNAINVQGLLVDAVLRRLGPRHASEASA